MAEEVEVEVEDGKAAPTAEEEKEETAAEEATETEASFRRKHFEERTADIWQVAEPIAIRDLSVKKDKKKSGGTENELPGAPNFITAIIGRWLAQKLGCMGKPPTQLGGNDEDLASSSEYVVSHISAVLNPGEATLLIAPSSSGKTTLMRTMANLCEGNIDNGKKKTVEGTLMIGGKDATDPKYKGCFRRSTVFADQGDLSLTPILTVEETVLFTTMCASSGSTEEAHEAVSAYLRLAGLSHVAGTVVGDAEVRGVSGGQKRRVKVLESTAGQDTRCVFIDEMTNGLDSASALASCQNVAVAVEKTGITAMISLLQPSVDMFEQFHRVILLTENGEMAYSGLRDGALDHFESLGLSKPTDMDEPEFLLRCVCNPADFASNKDDQASTPPSKAADLVSLFVDSPAGEKLSQDLDTAESSQTTKEEPAVLPMFARSPCQQLSLLLGRGWKLVMRDVGSIIRLILAVLFGLFVGTLFLNTPGDLGGTRTRAGYAFTMLMLMFMTAANAPMDGNFKDRPTFYCHRQANFYSTTAYYISKMICSWPVSVLEATFMSVCSFFLVGMEAYGGPGFLYFWLMAIVVSLCGNAVSRCLSYGFPSNDIAMTLGPAVLMVFQICAGFAPQYPNIPAWLRWLSWLSPCGYAMEGILVNELHTRNITGTNITGTQYGEEVLSFPRIPYDQAVPGMQTPGTLMAFDVYMILSLTIFLEICGCIVLNLSRRLYGPTTKRYQVTSGMSLTAGTDVTALLAKKGQGEVSDVPEKSSVPRAPPAHLTAKDIVYEVDVPVTPEQEESKGGEKEEEKEEEKREESTEIAEVDYEQSVLITASQYAQPGKGATQEWLLKKRLGEDAVTERSRTFVASTSIRVDADAQVAAEEGTATDLEPPAPGRLRLLSGVSATFSPATMTALMGSSGAGKTTLLDVLAGYKTGGYTEGSIGLNGAPKTDETWRLIAGYCEQTDLHNPAVTVMESLVFAARMRLRPFSGPFSLSEESRVSYCEDIMKLLEIEKYADILVGDEGAGKGLPKHARKRLTLGVELAANPSILFADEPTSGLDSVSASLVVSSLRRVAESRGVTVVCTIHQPSREVFGAFDNLLLLRKGGVVVYNGPVSGINDYITSVSGNDAYALKSGANPADHVLEILCGESEDWGKLYKQSDMASGVTATADACSCEHCKTAGIDVEVEYRGAFSQLRNVLQRQVVSHWRTPTYMAVRFWWTLAATLLIGLLFMDVSETVDGAFDLVGATFGFVNLAAVPLMSAAAPLITERAIYYREVSSGTYWKYVYAMAVELAELPFNLLMATVSWVIFYWLVGLDPRGDRVIYSLLMAYAVYWILPLFGQLFSFLSPNIGIASVLGGILMVAFTLTMGFLIPPDSIPPWWIWLYWINPLRYVLQGLAVNELGDGKEYLADGPFEQTVSGDVLLKDLGGWSFDQRWWYCYVVVLLFGFAASFGMLGATRISFMKR